MLCHRSDVPIAVAELPRKGVGSPAGSSCAADSRARGASPAAEHQIIVCVHLRCKCTWTHGHGEQQFWRASCGRRSWGWVGSRPACCWAECGEHQEAGFQCFSLFFPRKNKQKVNGSHKPVLGCGPLDQNSRKKIKILQKSKNTRKSHFSGKVSLFTP